MAPFLSHFCHILAHVFDTPCIVVFKTAQMESWYHILSKNVYLNRSWMYITNNILTSIQFVMISRKPLSVTLTGPVQNTWPTLTRTTHSTP